MSKLSLEPMTAAQDAARSLKISQTLLYAHIKRQNIRTVRIGRRHFIRPDEMLRICAEGLPPIPRGA